MGINDNYFSRFYTYYVKNVVKLQEIKEIAWLGWTGPNIFVEQIESLCPNLRKSDFFDIVTDNPQVIKWDINKQWDISGYDLVICLRTTMFVTNKDHFLSELGKTTKTNGAVIIDFMLPEVKRFSDFQKDQRFYIKKALGYPDKTEYYFSWDRPVFTMVESWDQHLSNSDWRPCGSTKDVKSGIVLSTKPHECALSFMKFGDFGGYKMMPKFDVIYKQVFKGAIGFDYDPEVVGYPSCGTVLTEQDLQKHKLDMVSISFMYALNQVPPEIGLNLEETGGAYIPIYERTPAFDGEHQACRPAFDKYSVIIGAFTSQKMHLTNT